MCTKSAALICLKTGDQELRETAVSERCPESTYGPPNTLSKRNVRGIVFPQEELGLPSFKTLMKQKNGKSSYAS